MTTFVTTYINYYKTPIENATHQLRLSRFKPLLLSKIPLCIFVTHDCLEILHQYLQTHNPSFNTHIKLIVLKKSFFESCYMYLTAAQQARPNKLPEKRFPPKDTFDFMCYSHTKVEFLRQACEVNPFKTEYFAWVDYDIANMFQDKDNTFRFLHMIANTSIANRKHPPTEHEPATPIDRNHQVYIPGCWEKHTNTNYIGSIHWRFCGCFMLVNIQSIQYLWSLYETHYVDFLRTYDTMVWDINFFAWLEHHQHWKPIWYKADHNDTIVRIPPYVYSETVSLFVSNLTTYDYPIIENFFPSSASLAMVPYQNRNIRVVNTRYVNYEYLPSGHCNIHDPHRNVYSRNVMCFLDHKFEPDETKQFHTIEEHDDYMKLQKVNDHQMFHGIEDIRLFQNPQTNRLEFVATTVNYSTCGKNRMMTGHYNLDTMRLEECKMIDPPQDTPREKNWIPFVSKKEPTRLLYIYKWSSVFQIGECVSSEDENGPSQLKIVHKCVVKSPMFQYYDIRGSSNPVWTHKGYVCLVHFSVDNTLPKQYYHMLVLLDLDTYNPKAHSKVFHFFDYGIEFCLSLLLFEQQYKFWISRQDRDPVCIDVPISVLPFDYKIETNSV